MTEIFNFLFSVGRCDAFGQVLEYLSVYNRDPVQFAIQYFHSRDVSYEQLRLLTKMCPKLTHVSLYVDEGNLLEPLISLENLSEVKASSNMSSLNVKKVSRIIS